MTKIAPKGCGKMIDGVIPCGDHIDLETNENGECLCQPVLCNDCWDKLRLNKNNKINIQFQDKEEIDWKKLNEKIN